MSVRRQSQAATPSAQPSRQTASGSRWLVVAVALCGALAGASIVEALAALTSQSSAPISPDHLIAAPLALAGAVCGGLLAAVLVSKDQRAGRSGENRVNAMPTSAEMIPADPMFWQPTPSVIAHTRLSESAAQPESATRRARRIRRAIRQHTSGQRHIHSRVARPAAHR